MTKANIQDWFVRTAERLGVPCAVLIVVFMFVWYVLEWFASQVATPLVQSHTEFLRQQTEVNQSNAEAIEKIIDVEQSQSQLLEEVHDHLVQRRGSRPP